MTATPKKRISALAYLRTSSAANVGGDSPDRQREAIRAYAERAGLEVAGEFYDAAVSGEDRIQDRAGFAAMLARIEGNGVRLVLVEDASRFARSVLAQELGILLMQRCGVRVVTAAGDDLTNTDDEGRVMIRQVFGAFSQMEKTRLVKKLRAARERVRAEKGRCEGRKPTLVGDALAMARRLRRKNPRTGARRSLREIAAELAEAGHLNPATKRPYSAEAIRLALGAGAKEAAA